jgi:hypothetical protein
MQGHRKTNARTRQARMSAFYLKEGGPRMVSGMYYRSLYILNVWRQVVAYVYCTVPYPLITVLFLVCTYHTVSVLLVTTYCIFGFARRRKTCHQTCGHFTHVSLGVVSFSSSQWVIVVAPAATAAYPSLQAFPHQPTQMKASMPCGKTCVRW